MHYPQFSLRTLLVVLTAAALYLALRQSFAAPTAEPTINPVLLPLLFAALLVAGNYRPTPTLQILRPVAWGACTSALVAAAVTIEIAEQIRHMEPNYWNWYSDIPALIFIMSWYALVGGTVGFITSLCL